MLLDRWTGVASYGAIRQLQLYYGAWVWFQSKLQIVSQEVAISLMSGTLF